MRDDRQFPGCASRGLARVVSVVCGKDLATWRVVSRQLLENVAAGAYEVVVPRSDLHAFDRDTPSAFRIVPEEEHLGGHSLQSIARALPSPVRDRAGWYLQQFVKLGACSIGDSDATNLIWDGDTVPLRRLDFFDATGELRFYASGEYHRPYFDTIERILGLRRATDRSFIAQCMPTRPKWVRGMIAEIERRSARSWIDAVLSSVPGLDASEFSEYESLGQFVTHRHHGEAAFCDRAWHRYGNSLIGGVECLDSKTIEKLSSRFDFISFEGWDRPAVPRDSSTAFNRVLRRLRARGASRLLGARRSS